MNQPNEKVLPARLLQASEEIEAIFKKHDVAGVVVLHCNFEETPGFCQVTANLGPSYSAVELNSRRNLVLRQDPPPSLTEKDHDAPRKRRLMRTLDMISNMRARTGELVGVLLQAELAIKARFFREKGKNGQQPGGPKQ